MWIRSQNLYVIANCEFVFIKQCEKEKFDVIGDRNILLGEYSTEKKALEVLDMIERQIQHTDTKYSIFQMLQDEDVES